MRHEIIRCLTVIELDYDLSEVWFVCVDSENQVVKFVFQVNQLSDWMISEGHDQSPGVLFADKWLVDQIDDHVLMAYLRHRMPIFQFQTETIYKHDLARAIR